MTTIRYRLFETILRLSGAGKAISKGLKRGNVPSENIPSGLCKRWDKAEFKGRQVFTCHPAGHDTGRIYVHQHGGAYVLGLISLHFSMFTKLADMAGVTIILPDYPLPPEMTATGIIEWATAHYDTVVAEHGADNVSLGGDSAGGNLALAIGQQRDIANPLLLLSPWVDLDMTSMADDVETDEILLDPASARIAAHRYAGELSPKDALVSPLFADPSTLPEVMIFTGEKDLLHADIMTFAERMRSAGKLSKLATYGEFGHYWMFYPTPDRSSTLTELAAIIAHGRPPETHSYR